MNIDTLLKDIKQIANDNTSISINEIPDELTCDICGKEFPKTKLTYYRRLIDHTVHIKYVCPACRINSHRLSEYRVHHKQCSDIKYSDFLSYYKDEIAWISDINRSDVNTYMTMVDKSIDHRSISHRLFAEDKAIYYVKPEVDYYDVWCKLCDNITAKADELEANDNTLMIDISDIPVDGRNYGVPKNITAPGAGIIAQGYANCLHIRITHRDLATRYPEDRYTYFEKSTKSNLFKPTVGTTQAFVILLGITPAKGNSISIQELDLDD